MKYYFNILNPLMLLLLISCAMFGQESDPVRYSIHDYMHVKPENDQEYRELEAVWKKVHQANIKAGNYDYWTLTRVVLPVGSSVEYNYVTRIRITGEDKLAAFMEGDFFTEETFSVLTEAEQALVAKTRSLRTHVKSEVTTVSHIIPPPEEGKANTLVYNFYDYPEGSNHRMHVAQEKQVWDPVHRARIDAGVAMGWVIASVEMPWQSAAAYKGIIVDIYKDLPTYLANRSPVPYMEKAHPGANVSLLFDQSAAVATRVRSEVRSVVDATDR